MNLDELQRLAEDAGDGYMEIEADTAKKLILVVMAVQALTAGYHPNLPHWPELKALRAALEELK